MGENREDGWRGRERVMNGGRERRIVGWGRVMNSGGGGE